MKYSNLKEFKKANIFGTGIPNFILKGNMTGKSYIKPIKMANGIMLANVTFSPGSRCFWHVHRATKGGGQIIICTAGEGWYQEEEKKAKTLKPGDTIFVKPGVKHWHGAKKDKWFSHLSIEVPGEECGNEWLEEVSDKDYLLLEK